MWENNTKMDARNWMEVSQERDLIAGVYKGGNESSSSLKSN